MGAISIERSAEAADINKAWKIVQEEDARELGEDIYNSGANNCELVKDVTAEFRRFKGGQEAFEDMIIRERATKRDMYGFCISDPIPNKNKIKTVVHNKPQHGTRKWETRYEVVPAESWRDFHTGISEKTQTEAIRKARAYVEKHPYHEVQVQITKILISGEPICAKITYKKSSTERHGKYCFVGFAPC